MNEKIARIEALYAEASRAYNETVVPGVSDDSVLEAERDTLEAVLAVLNADAEKPPTSTPNGYDVDWISAINVVLNDRETGLEISDINDAFWEQWIGPMVDAIERGNTELDVIVVDPDAINAPS